MAQSRVEVGVLDCRGSTTSFIVGSVTELSCAFRPAGGGPVEPYHATMRRAGVDLGFNQQIVGGLGGVGAEQRIRRAGI